RATFPDQIGGEGKGRSAKDQTTFGCRHDQIALRNIRGGDQQKPEVDEDEQPAEEPKPRAHGRVLTVNGPEKQNEQTDNENVQKGVLHVKKTSSADWSRPGETGILPPRLSPTTY